MISNSLFPEINDLCISTTFIQFPIGRDIAMQGQSVSHVFTRWRHIWSSESLRSDVDVGKRSRSFMRSKGQFCNNVILSFVTVLPDKCRQKGGGFNQAVYLQIVHYRNMPITIIN